MCHGFHGFRHQALVLAIGPGNGVVLAPFHTVEKLGANDLQDRQRATLLVVNAVGFLCEAAWHHADLSVTWGKVWVKLKTHSAGGITDKDFALARKIEDTVLWRPPAGGPLEGSPNKFVHSKP